MRYYYITIDENDYITSRVNTFCEDEGIALTEEEYTLALKHQRFNPETRTFTELIEEQTDEVVLKEIIKSTHQTTEAVAEDNIINMDMILEVTEKLNLIMEHLGL